MERLTYQRGKNHAVPTRFDIDFAFRIGNETWAGLTAVLDRLAAYEDTGLEPDEIKSVQASMNPIPFDRFREIMEAERDGRLRIILSTIPKEAPNA